MAQNELASGTRPRWRRLLSVRAGWLALAVWGLSMTLTALSLLLLFQNGSHPGVHIFDHWVEYTSVALCCSTIGVVIAWYRPENPVGWIFCATGLAHGAEHFASEYAIYALLAEPGSLPGAGALAWVAGWLWALALSLFVFLGFLFPDGRLPTRRWRPVAWLGATAITAGVVALAISPGTIEGLGPIRNPLGLDGMEGLKHDNVDSLVLALIGTLALVATVSLFVRLRRARGEEQQQIKWFVYAAVVLAVSFTLTYTVVPAASASDVWQVGFVFVVIGVLGFPVVVSIAVLKYHLYDIDIIINRTLVYGALTAIIVGIYALVVGTLGTLLQARGDPLVSLLAAGLAAVLFAPLRDRLQRGVNRLMYGERDDPYAALSRLGRRLEAALAPDATLATIVETVAQALKLPYAAISLKQNGGYATVAEHGSPADETITLTLLYQTEAVGQLILAPRSPGEAFSASDERLLKDLARQAGVAVHAVRLTADLQRSREQLVTAREEERRRLRRDLHDGLGPRLAAQTLKAGSVRSLYPRDPAAADTLLAGLETDIEAALADIRRLVYNLRPPALDELGLVGSIREAATQYNANGSNISVVAPERLPNLPAAVEVATYRIVQEALTNVVRHAKAQSCAIRISLDSSLELEITDDGVGLPEDRHAGVGLSSMRERAAELGGTCAVGPAPNGGTRVLARLPLPDDEHAGDY